jgi:predicted DNA-binding transcriptional regulator AlpA
MSGKNFKDEAEKRDSGIHIEPLLLRPCEAARILALSPRKLWTLTNMGSIPSVRIDGCVRYAPEDLRQWIQKQKQPAK